MYYSLWDHLYIILYTLLRSKIENQRTMWKEISKTVYFFKVLFEAYSHKITSNRL